MEVDQDNNALDEVKYSRLIYTIGRDAVESLRKSNVLIFGCKGLGAEVAKNMILCGTGKIGLVDDGIVSVMDLGSSFLLREENIGQSRAACTAANLKELNSDTVVDVLAHYDVEMHLKDYDVVVATNGTLRFLMQCNQMCRAHGIPMVAARSRGVFGFVFVDFGEEFYVKDVTGEAPINFVVESITQDFPATVTIVEEQRHGLEEGDEVVFHGVCGMEKLNELGVVTVGSAGNYTFTILVDTREFGGYTSGGYFYKVKSGKTMRFEALRASILNPVFSGHDPAKEHNLPALHIGFQAVDSFECLKHPDSLFIDSAALTDEDIDNVLMLAKEAAVRTHGKIEIKFSDKNGDSLKLSQNSSNGCVNAVNGGAHEGEKLTAQAIETKNDTGQMEGTMDEQIVKLLASGAHVELAPVVSIIGGIAAQEAIKAITGVFTPLNQWFYFDAMECLPSVAPSFQEKSASGSSHDAQAALFGRTLQEKISYGQWLVVGAGGIGCEVLKNLILIGVGCGPNSSIVVVDNDHVAKPNLADQVLYLFDDLGRLKAPTASRALRKINPAAQVRALHMTFGPDSESLFDSTFFDAISGVFSCVDTSTSRLYLDARCVAYRRPMIDGGKHGTKGSVQVFVPYLSEMYASSRDPPERKEIPICTLKNFPYAVEHTLTWAVDAFNSLFKKRPDIVNSYLSNRDFPETLKKQTESERQQVLEQLRDSLVKYKPLSFEACVEWARWQFEELFSNNIKQICHNFPADLKTSTGSPFWSGTKRLPVAINFDLEDSMHLEFIIAAANLQATVYGLKGCNDKRQFVQILKTLNVPEFQPKDGVKIAVTDNEYQNTTQRTLGTTGQNVDSSTSSSILFELPAPASLVGYRLSSTEFDMDDVSNFHVEFVHAAANLRAQNYGINSSEKLQARLVGGKAIPSIATTNAVVGGLMCLELYKILEQKALEEYKHSYFNLSMPLLTSANPMKAVENKVIRSQMEPLAWTLWDKFEMDCIGMSLEAFLKEFKQQHGLEVNMIMHGKSLLYAEFLNKKKLQERMVLSILELVHTVGKVIIPTTENKLILSLTCEDANDIDVEVPDVIVRVR